MRGMGGQRKRGGILCAEVTAMYAGGSRRQGRVSAWTSHRDTPAGCVDWVHGHVGKARGHTDPIGRHEQGWERMGRGVTRADGRGTDVSFSCVVKTQR